MLFHEIWSKEEVEMLRYFKWLSFCLVGLYVIVSLGACGGGDAGVASNTGTLGIGLTDATTDQYQAIYVTIAEVQVKKLIGEAEEGVDVPALEEEGWITVLTPGQTFNLLELVNGVVADLGLAELDAGDYGQMRLILGELPEPTETNILGDPHPYANYLIKTEDGSVEDLKIPSGYETGVKIVHAFTIAAMGATEIILDFDALKSVVEAGSSGQWLLKPTIKVLETLDNSVEGLVSDGAGPLEGALVSAQLYDAEAVDPRDEVMVEGATASDINGAYFLYLVPGTYNMVATMAGYLPDCVQVEAAFFEAYSADLTLVPAVEFGGISGTVSGLDTVEDSALLSIRQSADCGSLASPVMIEVASLNVFNGAGYTIDLPSGT